MEENVPVAWLCGHVARGQALVSELLSLSDRLPPALTAPSPRHAAVLLDFSYLRDADAAEAACEASEALRGAWEEVRRAAAAPARALFRLLAAVAEQHRQLAAFCAELDGGGFTSHTLEEVVRSAESKQLLLEALALAVQLPLLLDERVEGPTRERLVVAHLRCAGRSEQEAAGCEQVVRLARSSGRLALSQPAHRPRGWPESYLARFPLPADALALLLGRLRLDDVYGGQAHFPGPAQRGAALAGQAAPAFLLLYHSVDTLESDPGTMRELVDRHFADGWVLPWAPGQVVDLTVAWAPYAAARAALDTCLPPAAARRLAERYSATLRRLLHAIPPLLQEGLLDDDFLLSNHEQLFGCVRDGNVALRWLALHARPPDRSPPMARAARPRPPPQPGRLLPVCAAASPGEEEVLDLLLLLSRLEESLCGATATFLARRSQAWAAARDDACRQLAELAAFYGGGEGGSLSAAARDASLAAWFARLRAAVAELDEQRPAASGRRLAAMAAALGEVEGLRAVQSSLAARAAVGEAREAAARLRRLLHVPPSALAQLGALTDAAWAWAAAGGLAGALRARLAARPGAVLHVRALLLKLRTLMELPLLRAGQCGAGGELERLSRFYSGRIAAFAADVLRAVPASLFAVLSERVAPRAAALPELPTRLEKAGLREAAALAERAALAEATHQATLLTRGMLAIDAAPVGGLRLDARRLLARGLARALGRRVDALLQEGLGRLEAPAARGLLGGGARPLTRVEFEDRLGEAAGRLRALRGCFEAAQDFVSALAGGAWGCEMHAAAARALRRERGAGEEEEEEEEEGERDSSESSGSEAEWSEEEEAGAAERWPRPPPPRAAAAAAAAAGPGWLVALAAELRRQAAPPSAYLCSHGAWFAPGPDETDCGAEALGVRAAGLLRSAVGLPGLQALQTLLHRQATAGVARAADALAARLGEEGGGGLAALLAAACSGPGSPAFLGEAAARAGRLLGGWPALTDALASIGTSLLLQSWLAAEQERACAVDARHLHSAVRCAAAAAAAAAAAGARARGGGGGGGDEAREAAAGLAAEVAALQLSTGLRPALAQPPPPGAAGPLRRGGPLGAALPMLALLFTVHSLGRYESVRRLGGALRPLRRHAAAAADAAPLAAGLCALLRAAGGGTLGEYARRLAGLAGAQAAEAGEAGAAPPELAATLAWAASLVPLGGLRQRELDRLLPPWIAATLADRAGR